MFEPRDSLFPFMIFDLGQLLGQSLMAQLNQTEHQSLNESGGRKRFPPTCYFGVIITIGSNAGRYLFSAAFQKTAV